MPKQINIKSILPLVLTFCFAVSFFTLVFRTDNKYFTPNATAPTNQTELTQNSLSDATYLVHDWDLYPGVLLTPKDIKNTESLCINTFVGQYLNLTQLSEDSSPYGVSTWRLQFNYAGATQEATLLLPEVFCAFRLYVNGALLAQRGSIQPYQPFVQDTTLSFPLQRENEIILQTANYTHYYSGLTYPPVLASTQVISEIIGSRLLFYGFICFGALIASLFSVALWLNVRKSRDTIALLFGILAVAFSVFTLHTFVWFFGSSLVRLLYALEDAMFALIVWCAINICLRLSSLYNTTLGQTALRICIAFLIISIVVPTLIMPTLPAFALLYGKIITFYRIFSAIFLIGLAIYGSKKSNAIWMLCGTGFYGTGILFSALTISTFEPARFGWMEEYSALALVVCFGILMVRRSYAIVAENLRLTENLRKEVTVQTQEIGLMVKEREDLLSKFLHDMKSPSAFMISYAEMIRHNNIRLDEQTKKQLAVIEEKCGAINKQIRIVQEYTAKNPLITPHTEINLEEFLQEFYRFNRPDVEMDGQTFLLRINVSTPYIVFADPDKLNRMLQNLIYNAVSFTPPEGKIVLLLNGDENYAYIKVTDTGVGIPKKDIPKIFDRFFTSRLNSDGTGMGLYIVRTIVQEHGGEISVKSKVGKGTQFTVKLPVL